MTGPLGSLGGGGDPLSGHALKFAHARADPADGPAGSLSELPYGVVRVGGTDGLQGLLLAQLPRRSTGLRRQLFVRCTGLRLVFTSGVLSAFMNGALLLTLFTLLPLLLFTAPSVDPFARLAGQLELPLFTPLSLLALRVQAAQPLFVLALLTALGRFPLGALLCQLGGVLARFPLPAFGSFPLPFTLLTSQARPFIALGLFTLGLFTLLTLDAFKRRSDRAPVGQPCLRSDDQKCWRDRVNSDADQVAMKR